MGLEPAGLWRLPRLPMSPMPKPRKPLTASDIPVHCACTEIVGMHLLIPNARNPNTHPPRQIELLAKIIKTQGWRSPIVVSKTSGFIVKGHGRYQAAQLLGATEVPVDYQTYASEAEEWADMVADNRIAELAGYDQSSMQALLEGMSSEIDIELTGFTLAEFDAMTLELGKGESQKTTLPPADVTGTDDQAGRFILVYTTPEQKQRWCDLLGIDGEKAVWSVNDLPEASA